MAEEILVSAALQGVTDRLGSPLLERLSSMWDLKDNLEKLQSTLPKLQTVLEDDPQAVGIWLTLLKESAFNVEDLLEELTTICNNNNYEDDDHLLGTQFADRVREAYSELQSTADEVLRLNGVAQ